MEVKRISMIVLAPYDLIIITDTENYGDLLVENYLELTFIFHVADHRLAIIVPPGWIRIPFLIYD